MTLNEFESVIMICRDMTNKFKRYHIPSYFIFQYNMIGRVDDVAHTYLNNVMSSPKFPFSLMTRMCWSKNVSEERDAPDQILLGAMNPSFCVMLALAVHLEIWLEEEDSENSFLFGLSDNPDNSRSRAAGIFRECLQSKSFVPESFFTLLVKLCKPFSINNSSYLKFFLSYYFSISLSPFDC